MKDSVFDNVWQKRCFQFFRQKTVNSTNALIDARFWDRVVLRAVHSEPAVKHGILALSIFDQYLAEDQASTEYRLLADEQYHSCLKQAQELLSRAKESEIEHVLITCIICIHYEVVRGRWTASTQHMDNGRAILRQYSQKIRQASRRSDLAEIQQAFARLDAACGSFANRSSPWLSTLDDFHDTAPFLRAWQFNDVYEARNCLFDLSRWLLLTRHQLCRAWFGGEMDKVAKFAVEKNLSKIRLQEWNDYFEIVAQKSKPCTDSIVLTLRMWYTGLILLVEPDAVGPETRWDQYIEDFERLIALGEQISSRLLESEYNHFSYDIGYATPMLMAAHRCRDPHLRRRAIKVLRALPRREGNLLTVPAADMLERLVQYEEGNQIILTASDVPEERRVWFVSMEFDYDKGELESEFLTKPGEDFQVVVERVYWIPAGGQADRDSS